MKTTDPINAEMRAQIRSSAGWGIAIGIFLMVLGAIATARPFYATVASAVVFGWLFVTAGIAHMLYAMRSSGVGQFIWKLLLSILYLGVGVYTLGNPATGAMALTLALGVTIFIQGVFEVILAFHVRPSPSWLLVLLGGIFGIILGIFIWSRFPDGADWIVGLWVGLHFLFTGTWIFILSLGVRSALR